MRHELQSPLLASLRGRGGGGGGRNLLHESAWGKVRPSPGEKGEECCVRAAIEEDFAVANAEPGLREQERGKKKKRLSAIELLNVRRERVRNSRINRGGGMQ